MLTWSTTYIIDMRRFSEFGMAGGQGTNANPARMRVLQYGRLGWSDTTKQLAKKTRPRRNY